MDKIKIYVKTFEANDSNQSWVIPLEFDEDSGFYNLVRGKLRIVARNVDSESLMLCFPSVRPSNFRSTKNPVLAGISDLFRTMISKSRSRYSNGAVDFEGIISIYGCPILLKREKTRYSINGLVHSVDTICNSLARLLLKARTVTDSLELMKYLYEIINLPENVRYALENKVPYHFYTGFEKVSVRLNIERIGDDDFALEVSDGIWGTINTKDLTVFVNTYLYNKKRGSWKNLSPSSLFERTVGRKPKESDVKLMLEFLKQNRTSALVEDRARNLVKDLENQYSEKVLVKWDENDFPSKIFVHGKHYDWLLTSRPNGSATQRVSVYVYQPLSKDHEKRKPLIGSGNWAGPICIDNMTTDSSLGDQFAARLLALLNDDVTIKIVGTIKGYLKSEPNTNRIDKNEMQRMFNGEFSL